MLIFIRINYNLDMSSKRNPEKTIQEYLEKQNRPYSAGDIFLNLHKEFGKTAVVKALEGLAENGKVIEKIYGKQKVYGPCQERFGDIKPEELTLLDTKTLELQEELKKLQSEIHQQEHKISIFSKQMSTEYLSSTVTSLINNNLELSTKIDSMKIGKNLISKEVRQNINKKTKIMVSQWKKRKRLTTDMVDCILEGYPKTKKNLIEEIGIETDEEAGHQIPKIN